MNFTEFTALPLKIPGFVLTQLFVLCTIRQLFKQGNLRQSEDTVKYNIRDFRF